MTERERIPNVLDQLRGELYMDLYGIPLSWSLRMARYDNELGEFHRNYIRMFNLFLEGEGRDPVEINRVLTNK